MSFLAEKDFMVKLGQVKFQAVLEPKVNQRRHKCSFGWNDENLSIFKALLNNILLSRQKRVC